MNTNSMRKLLQKNKMAFFSFFVKLPAYCKISKRIYKKYENIKYHYMQTTPYCFINVSCKTNTKLRGSNLTDWITELRF